MTTFPDMARVLDEAWPDGTFGGARIPRDELPRRPDPHAAEHRAALQAELSARPTRPRSRSGLTPPRPADRVILAGLARGRRSCGIAEDLHTAHETVRSRMWRMRSRLGARNSAHAVAIAYEAGWMDGLAPEPRSLKPLRDRDQRTLEGIAQGLTRREIAKRLGITAREVEGAIRRLCHHLSAEDRCHAVALAYQHGLLPTLPERRRQPCT